MAFKFGNNLDLQLNQLLNALLQNLPSHPTPGRKGQLYFNTTENMPYIHNGTAFVPIGSGFGEAITDGTITGNGTALSPLTIAASILTDIAAKQTQLTSGQLDAVNSGVTAQFITQAQTALSNLDSGTNPVLRLLSVLDVLDSTDKTAPLSADAGRRLRNMIADAAENGKNLGAFDTRAAFLAAYPVPPLGAYAYVRADEAHGGETWRYDQGLDADGETLIWSDTIKLEKVPRDFTLEPISAAELADGAVTLAKLASSAFDTVPTDSSTKLIRSGDLLTFLIAGFLSLTGNQTVAGQKTFSDTTVLAGHMKVSFADGDVVIEQI
ncbi:MAG: hypothetical protein LBS19_13730 [Clostridiales bacterium]|jgi:hypothetical protein|nr:hypothetical protein [Clostridiales bacterium]